MTENEAINALKLEGGLEIKGKPLRVAQFFEGVSVAIKALEENQLYHELGTTTEIIGQQYELQTFHAIGTVEEFRALKEKNTPKKAIRKKGMCYSKTKDGTEDYEIIEECPTCKERLYAVCFNVGYCSCGQRIMP